MARDGVTIREATEEWVKEMNAFPYEMIEKLYESDPDDWHEITVPSRGDRVYVYGKGSGEITGSKVTEDGVIYTVDMDESLLEPLYGDKFKKDFHGKEIEVPADELEVEYDSILPMWGTMWSFGDSADDYWLEDLDGVRIMSECGFRIYESEQFGYFFGIDGAGYSFYEGHWIPLYKARGLQWHDPRTETEEYVMTEDHKAYLYDGMLSYLKEMIGNKEELVSALKQIGFRDRDIAFEGLEVETDENDDRA